MDKIGSSSGKKIYTNEVAQNIDKTVSLFGCVDTIRDHGGLTFLHIRDYLGILQATSEQSLDLREEDVVKVTGKIIERPKDQENTSLLTGKYEIQIKSVEVISKSLPLPVDPEDASELNKMKYRALYLRKGGINIIKKRYEIVKMMRDIMDKMGFVEVETPILTADSPEGSRSFVVPSRLQKGKYYALPQSPQLFKQILMCSGLEKYFQVARCFRDEDARSDRLFGEFSQLDFEVAFSSQEAILDILKTIVTELFEKFSTKKFNFSRMSYSEALENYGTDKPDLRYSLKIEDYEFLFKNSDFKIFADALRAGKVVKGIFLDGELTVKERENLINFARDNNLQVAEACLLPDAPPPKA